MCVRCSGEGSGAFDTQTSGQMVFSGSSFQPASGAQVDRP